MSKYIQWYSFVSPCFPLFHFLIYIFNVIRQPLSLDQEHLSTVVIFSLAIATIWGCSLWPHTQRAAIKWLSPSKNLFKQLIYMLSGNQDRHRQVLCHCWRLVFSSSLDGGLVPTRYLHNSDILRDQVAPYVVLR